MTIAIAAPTWLKRGIRYRFRLMFKNAVVPMSTEKARRLSVARNTASTAVVKKLSPPAQLSH